MSKLGKLVKSIREEKGLTLRDFGQLCGLSHSYIDKLEKGIDPRNNKPVIPTIDTLQKIATATGYPLEKILQEAGYMEENNEESLEKKYGFATKAYHNLDVGGLSDEDISKVEEYIELLKQKYNPDGTLKKKD